MSTRRNTCAAVLLLAALCAAMLTICLGLLPSHKGLLDPQRPSRPRPSLTSLQQPKQSRRWTRVQPGFQSETVRVCKPIRGSVALPDLLLRKLDQAGQAVEDLNENTATRVNTILDQDHAFIELYGGAQRLMGRRVVVDPEPKYTVVRLTDRMLSFANLEAEQVDMSERAREMVVFARRVQRRFGADFLYVQAPSKLDIAALPSGIQDYSDAEADQFLARLETSKIDTLDLRPVFREMAETDPEKAEELFFYTDHHWTPAGAFLAYQSVCEKLAEDYDLELDEELTDPRSFEKYTFDDVFLGSQGKRVGTLYDGVDSMEIWSPKFSTDFTYTAPLSFIQREGPFAVSLLFPERLAETGLYDTNPYVIYAGGDYLLSRAVNHNNPDGLRVLILRDSYGCAFTPFLSLACGEVMAMDCRAYNGDQELMMEQIAWLDPDLVIVMNSTSSLRVDELFPYLPTARANALAAKAAGEEADGS